MTKQATAPILTLMLACTTLVTCPGQELLVSSFASDRVGRYELSSGDYLGPYQEGVGLDSPLAARIGPDGLVYVASEGSNEILRYNQDGSFVDVFVSAGAGGLDNPTGMTWAANGDMYVPSFANDSIIRYDGMTGEYIDTPISSGQGLNGPDNGTSFGPDGKLYGPVGAPGNICESQDTLYASLARLNPDGALLVSYDCNDAIYRISYQEPGDN